MRAKPLFLFGAVIGAGVGAVVAAVSGDPEIWLPACAGVGAIFGWMLAEQPRIPPKKPKWQR